MTKRPLTVKGAAKAIQKAIAPSKADKRYAAKPTPVVHPITSDRIKSLSAKGEKDGASLTPKEVQTLAASVQRHIEPRKGRIV
jgi:hypothetical protein